ncbi:hypothetical protein AB0876_32265 [Mycobacterium sp. NPDC049093]
MTTTERHDSRHRRPIAGALVMITMIATVAAAAISPETFTTGLAIAVKALYALVEGIAAER